MYQRIDDNLKQNGKCFVMKFLFENRRQSLKQFDHMETIINQQKIYVQHKWQKHWHSGAIDMKCLQKLVSVKIMCYDCKVVVDGPKLISAVNIDRLKA